jgi:hypothetical protein
MHEQAERLMIEVDWSRLAETLRLRRLLTTLGPRIIELADGRASADFLAAVEQAIEIGRRQGTFLQVVTLRVMAALADAGIRSAPLKGPLLGEAIYGDPGRRLSSDIDLLVAPEQLQAAVEVVRGFGYGKPVDHVEPNGLPQLHFALAHERNELPPIELHWRIHWYEQSFAQERLLPPAEDPKGSWRPAPADELAALLLFYARDGFVDLRLAADLSAWWDVFGGELGPNVLDEFLCVYPALARVVQVAIRVAEVLVGLPAAQIGEVPKLGLRDRMAVRLANPNPHASQTQLYAEMELIDGLLTPPGGFGAFVRRQLLLPREVLDEHDRRAPKRRLRSSLGDTARVLIRCGVLIRYGLAMVRLIRAPETLRVLATSHDTSITASCASTTTSGHSDSSSR